MITVEFFGKNFYEKGDEKFSGREIFDGERSGAIELENDLRHTDGIGRGNVRSTSDGREMFFGDDENWGENKKERYGLR